MSSVGNSDKQYQRAWLIVNGWSRISSSKSIPMDILPIIIKFYYEEFKWDRSLHDNGLHVKKYSWDNWKIEEVQLTFLNNDKTVKTPPRIKIYYCPSTHILSKNIHSFVKWGLTVDKLPGQRFLGCIGYVEYPYHNKNNENKQFPAEGWNYWMGNSPCTKYQFCLHSYHNTVKLHGGNKCKGSISSKLNSTKIKVGDRYEIHFDFDKMQSLLYFNDKFMGIMYKDLPQKLVPAIVMLSGHQITATKWELIYRKM